jgi:hypothetical protein
VGPNPCDRPLVEQAADYETAVVMQRAGHTCSRQVAPLHLRDTSFLRKQVPDAIRRSARAVSGGDEGCPNGRPFLHALLSLPGNPGYIAHVFAVNSEGCGPETVCEDAATASIKAQ